VVKKGAPGRSSEKFHLNGCQSFFNIFLSVQNSLPYTRIWTASALSTFILDKFWTKFGLKSLFIIPSIGVHFVSFCSTSSFSQEISQPRYVIFFTSFKHLLSTAILHLKLSCPKMPLSQISLVIYPFQNCLLSLEV